MRMGLFAPLLLALPLAAAAQSNGELWEITSQMNIPGMPAGMGAQTQRVCQGADPAQNATRDKERQDCKVTDVKQTATRTTVTMTCPQGRAVIDQTYNAARTEFKGAMRFSGRDGEMTMNTSGRKLGACNVQEAKREREEKMAAVKKQVDAGMAASATAQKREADRQIKECAAAVERMEFSRLGVYGECYKKKSDAQCKSTLDVMHRMSPAIGKACNARVAEFCKRYQTQEGFLKTKGDETVAQSCGVSTASIKAAQCPRAAQGGSLAFLGAFCPEESKPIAQEHCAGRDYTSKLGGKYAQFCQSYLANADFERAGGSQPQAAPAQQGSAADQVKQGIGQGLNKLKGLFGR